MDGLPALQQVAGALAERRLSTRDKRLRDGLKLPLSSEYADLQADLRPSNLDELYNEIARQRDPARRAILEAEARRLMEAQKMLRANKYMPLLPGAQPTPQMQDLDYDPRSRPTIMGGQQEYRPLPKMTY